MSVFDPDRRTLRFEPDGCGYYVPADADTLAFSLGFMGNPGFLAFSASQVCFAAMLHGLKVEWSD